MNLPLFLPFLIGIGSQLLIKREIFPIFSWFLFSRTPNQETHFKIVIYKHNNQTLNPPISFHQAPQSIAQSGVISATFVIDKLGNSYLQGKQEDIKKQRQILENNYLNGNVEYELIRESFDPIKKWKYNQVEQEILVRFNSGEF